MFKKNNKLYTINYYKKEVIADYPKGIICYNCGIKTFTQAEPCINYNCKSFSETLHKKYIHRNR